jgi:LPS O-antigen subunit length determinant protein (WzzB/FepE family)
MKRSFKVLISLYPTAWRNRYGNEFRALLDEVPPTWRTLFDVFGGALKMQTEIWSPLKIVAAFAVAGAVVAGLISLTVPDRYASMAVIKMGDADTLKLSAALQQVQSRSFLTQLINEQDLYKTERGHMPMEDVVEQMKREDIRVWVVAGAAPRAFAVSFASTDRAQAQRTTQRLASQFVDAHIGELLDPANLPAQPDNPRRSRIVIVGSIFGVIAGMLFALFNGLKVWKLATALGIACAVLAAAVSYAIPDRFSSSAVLADVGADQPRVRAMIGMVTSSDSIHAIGSELGLYPNDARADRKVSEHLHVQQLGNGRAILIQFDYPDRLIAQRVTQNVVARLIKQDWNFEILDPVSSPPNPISPNRATITGMGLFVGLAAAVVMRVTKRSLPAVVVAL